MDDTQSTTVEKLNISSKLALVALMFTMLVAFFTPVFSIMGYYYEYGWLNAFGLSRDWVPFVLENELLNFYSMVTNSLVYEKLIPYIIIFGVFILILMVSVTFLVFIGFEKLSSSKSYVKSTFFLSRIFKKLKLTNTKDFGVTFGITTLTILIPAAVLVILVIVSKPAKFAFDISYEEGIRVIENFKSCNDVFERTGWKKCVTYIDKDAKKYTGYTVFNTEKYIALFDGKVTYVIGRKTGEMITRELTVKVQKP